MPYFVEEIEPIDIVILKPPGLQWRAISVWDLPVGGVPVELPSN